MGCVLQSLTFLSFSIRSLKEIIFSSSIRLLLSNIIVSFCFLFEFAVVRSLLPFIHNKVPLFRLKGT